MEEKKVNLNVHNSRTEEQKVRMEKAEKEALCPFCPDGLIEIHQKEILWSNDSWLVTESAFPYEGTEHHFLILSKKHISQITDLSPKDWADQGEAMQWLINTKKIDGGATFTRFGNMKKNGTSIEHFHVHVISGNADEDIDKSERESIKVKLGYKKII